MASLGIVLCWALAHLGLRPLEPAPGLVLEIPMRTTNVPSRLTLALSVSTILILGAGRAAAFQETRATAKAQAKVDVNKATAVELETLPGVGPALSKAIIEGRPYQKVDDLERVKGMGPAKLAELKGLVVVGPPASPAGPKPSPELKAKSSAKAIDINTATAAELETLPGVGPALAKAIIDDRPYDSVDDLDRVKGLGPSKLDDLADLVTASPPTPAAKAKADAAPKAKTAAKRTAKSKTTLAPGRKINVNTATRAEIEELPLIGPAKAQAIIDHRPFKKIEDLKEVKGIGDVTFDRIKENVSIN